MTNNNFYKDFSNKISNKEYRKLASKFIKTNKKFIIYANKFINNNYH